jgi:hypothetical protein
MTNNQWEKTYGARRRAIDKALLAEAERQITAQEHATLAQDDRLASEASQAPKTPERASWLNEDARQRVAKAFGRAPG